jgi:hypothetical protein
VSKKAAIAEVVKVRDQLVIIRERLFQLSAATAARTREVEGLLIDCAAAGRVFGAPIGLPDWNNVLAMPGHQSAPSLDYELQGEMERVTKNIFWNSPESGLDRTNNDLLLLQNLVTGLDEWVQSRPAPKRTLRHIVLERLGVEVVQPAGFGARSSNLPDAGSWRTSSGRRNFARGGRPARI